MPRKVYLADLATAQKASCIESISQVACGVDDGEFTFIYASPSYRDKVKLFARISDVSDYPKDHDYLIFASDDAPSAVAESLQRLRSTAGKSISECLSLIAKHLNANSATGERDAPFEIDSDDDATIQHSQAKFPPEFDPAEQEVNNEDWDLDDLYAQHNNSTPQFAISPEAVQMRSDLISAKIAGFKIGLTGNPGPGCCCYISVSCRLSKLGISEEAMQAWDVEPSSYIILLLYYASGYQPLHRILTMHPTRRLVEMRVGISKFYKPRTLEEAQHVFTAKPGKLSQPTEVDQGKIEIQAGRFRDCFISKPLNALLSERFISIINYRLRYGMSWEASEQFYNDYQGANNQMLASPGVEYRKPESVPVSLPALVTKDEILTESRAEYLSFPLLAMRFLLRHFVRCTEFCLVCHCKISTDLDAIKPYVCEKPLCLYQFMSLGFGPGIEHEIIAQPCVVDLLISFCYVRSMGGKLEDFPVGLQLNVPYVGANQTPYQNTRLPVSLSALDTPCHDNMINSYKAVIQSGLRAMRIIDSKPLPSPLRKGDWIQIFFPLTKQSSWHTRIVEDQFFPYLKFSSPIFKGMNSADAQLNEPICEGQEICFRIYDRNFDTLSKDDMRFTICQLLDLLPSIDELRTWLTNRTIKRLSDWVDRISPSTLAVLRWIVASNRACIMQVDQPQAFIGHKPKRTEDRVQGIPGYMQFRFATGAPDKEQRFINQVRAVSTRIGSKFPTRFAWHGSGLENWHSIIREGLHFNSIAHGRAFGNGIYLAPEFAVSSGYTQGRFGHHIWPQSYLKITHAVSLNEIVNAPQEYVSSSPHFVLSHLDWVQTRYLFVKVTTDIKLDDTAAILPGKQLAQDPDRPPTCSSGPIVLPLSAVPRSRRIMIKAGVGLTTKPLKSKLSGSFRRKRPFDSLDAAASAFQTKIVIELDDDDDDIVSVSTLPEDLEILSEPPTKPLAVAVSKSVASRPTTSDPTKFTPFNPHETLSKLPLLTPPSYASLNATKRLQKDFRSLNSLQESHIQAGTLTDLGWYLNVSLLETTNNLYQWIIQMHSFPIELPLASDMKARGISSVVFEVLFHANYPISPPFLRVVRPRFLPFLQGGGGHVTMGGSICMDLLTSSGWSPAYDMAAVLLQVRMALMSTDPRPARLEKTVGVRGLLNHSVGRNGDYTAYEAVDAFKRAAQAHGWTVPVELDAMMTMRSAV